MAVQCARMPRTSKRTLENKKPNISRMTEYALSSILDYLDT